jgi:hypothetical protein
VPHFLQALDALVGPGHALNLLQPCSAVRLSIGDHQ